MDERRYSHLLDLIYAATADPGLWVIAMEAMADTLGGNSAWLSQLSVEDGSGSGLLARIDPVMPGRYVEYYARLNPFANIAQPGPYLSRWTATIQTDTDWYAKDELIKTEYYNDFMRPQQVHSVLMIDLDLKGVETTTVNINRAESRGPFGAAERAVAAALHPHLIRAFKLSRVFTGPKIRGEAAVAALDHSSHGLFILDGAGRVGHVNRAGERIIARRLGLGVVAGRLVGPNARLSNTLDGLILMAGSADPTSRRGGAMALPSAVGAAPLSITVAPLQAERLPMFSGGPSILVCVTDLESDIDVPEAKMRDLFGLTAAEARVARLLLRGAKPRQVAETTGVGMTTVRSQLSSIFDKTGATDQADLSRLMMRLTGAGEG
jgi:DNA-binding CsgD family transcriptional regulator/PAS domain-containing protein